MGRGKGKQALLLLFFLLPQGMEGRVVAQHQPVGRVGAKGNSKGLPLGSNNLSGSGAIPLHLQSQQLMLKSYQKKTLVFPVVFVGVFAKSKQGPRIKKGEGPFSLVGAKTAGRLVNFFAQGRVALLFQSTMKKTKKVEVVLKGLFFFLKNQLSISNPTL